MFTGLIEAVGTVRGAVPEGAGRRLEIEQPLIASGSRVGDSVAVNGACLTVVAVRPPLMAFQAGPETLSRTTLGRLKPGCHVNLERALAMGDRLGGHFVQGHIDGLAVVDRRQPGRQWELFWFTAEAALTEQMVSKGSVALDGVSLTLVDVADGRFSVALIPHTLAQTTLGRLQAGDPVNVETDVLGKYVRRFLQAGAPAERVDRELLRRAGFV